MLVSAVAAILDRDLRTLSREVMAYPDEKQLWQVVPSTPNVGGTLVLHLVGNIRYYIGAKLGATGYVRDRPTEFARRDVPRKELLAQIESARADLAGTFASLRDESLPAAFPDVIAEMHVATEEYLLHLLTHFAYHLGQLDTHRRIVTADPAGVGAMRPAELVSAKPARA